MMAFRLVWLILKQDLQIARRRAFAYLNPLLFYIFIVSLFPLGIGPYPAQLQAIAPGLLWVGVLLAILLALERLFRDDFSCGFLDRLLLAGESLPLLVGVKVLAQWLVLGLPLVLLGSVLGLAFHLSMNAVGVLALSLLLGTPVLLLMGAIGAALTLGLRQSGLLLPLLILPWFIPVLIFATGAVSAADQGLPFGAQLEFLAALLCITAAFAPWAMAFALRLQVAE